MYDREDRNVALKALAAEADSSANRELAILQHLKSHDDPQHPGHKHVQQLLDSFYIQGPNGKHLCIVWELMGPSLSAVADTLPARRLDTKLALKFIEQLLQAVDYIHSCGVVHGGKLLPHETFNSVSDFDQISTRTTLFFTFPKWCTTLLRWSPTSTLPKLHA